MRLINRKDREAAVSGQVQPHFAGLRGLVDLEVWRSCLESAIPHPSAAKSTLLRYPQQNQGHRGLTMPSRCCWQEFGTNRENVSASREDFVAPLYCILS
jgi:hypothetical protein